MICKKFCRDRTLGAGQGNQFDLELILDFKLPATKQIFEKGNQNAS